MTVVEEIKERVDLVELISRYTPLKKAGATYKGICPFHTERTPSFVVYADTGHWHCFGACGTGGDAFSFLMQKENLDFREALEMLAQEVGVELDRTDEDPQRKLRTRIFDANQAAADYFHAVLLNHPGALAARSYLERRHIDDQTTEQFQLGYALDAWTELRDHLSNLGYSIEDQLAAGLLKQNEQRNSTYDAFRGRVIIPIRNRQSRVIGFGGRVLGDGVPKYLNTAETPVFHKSSVVYGLDLAYRAIADRKQAVIVEGYMDVIAAHQFGFNNVVACMGTAVTEEQLRTLERYTNNYVLALDADAAGQQATLRALSQARQALARVQKPRVTPSGRMQMEERLAANLSITSMPAGRDPDDVIRNDPKEWAQFVENALPLVDFYFRVVSSQVDLDTAQGKAEAVSQLVALIAELGDDIEQQHYIQELSRLVKVDERTIADRVQAAAKAIRVTGQPLSPATKKRQSISPTRGEPGPEIGLESPPFEGDPWDGPIEPDPFAGSRPGFEVDASEAPAHRKPARRVAGNLHEEHLLAIVLQDPDLLIWLAGAADKLEIDPLLTSDLQSVENQAILLHLKRFISSDEIWDPEAFQDGLSEHVHGRFAELMVYSTQLPISSVDALREDAAKTLVRIRLQRLQEQTTSIRYLLEEAQQRGDLESVLDFGANIDQYVRERSHLEQKQPRIGEILFDRGGHRRNGVRLR